MVNKDWNKHECNQCMMNMTINNECCVFTIMLECMSLTSGRYIQVHCILLLCKHCPMDTMFCHVLMSSLDTERVKWWR